MFAVGLSFGLISLDREINFEIKGFLRFIFSSSPASARTILSTISGAMIGVAGTVFSITLVALTLASSQFGSRLLRNFMFDKLNQVVLGTYVATFVYCLLVLNSVTDTQDFQFIPVISVFVALLIAIVNIVLLIVFIHHVAVSIQSDHVISNISKSLSKNIKSLLPDQNGELENVEEVDIESLKKKLPNYSELNSLGNGYLQTIDIHKLTRLAKKNNFIIILLNRPGDYLVEGIKICEVYSEKKLSDDLNKKMKNAFILGNVRTPIQDAEYAIHQMVEIASRALSPGINDPYTAIACIDNLTSVLSYLARAKFPSPYCYDEDGNLRIISFNLTFNGMLDAAFNQIRQFSSGNLSVIKRLMDALIIIYKSADNIEYKRIILQHAKMVYNLANDTVREEQDLSIVTKSYESFERQ